MFLTIVYKLLVDYQIRVKLFEWHNYYTIIYLLRLSLIYFNNLYCIIYYIKHTACKRNVNLYILIFFFFIR